MKIDIMPVMADRLRLAGTVTKENFRQLTDPGQPDPFMASLGFSLRQAIGGGQIYSLSATRDNRIIYPLWVTLSDGQMAVNLDGVKTTEEFSRQRVVDLVREARQLKPGWKFPRLPQEFEEPAEEEDDQIFASGIDEDGEEEYRLNFESIPWEGSPMYHGDQDADDYGLDVEF